MSASDTVTAAVDRLSRWFPLTLIALGILAWSNAYSCAFIFDDKGAITVNPRMHRLWPPWEAVTVPTRFVAEWSFALNHALGGLNPADYHLTNLAIHIVAGLTLYGLLRRTLRLPRLAGRFGGQADIVGFLVAALWLVHPLQTGSVTYIVQREESLMGAFFLGVFYTFVRSCGSARPGAWRALCWALCLAGMATKEVMVTAPALLILFDATFVCDGWGDLVRRRWKFHAAMLLSLLLFAWLFMEGVQRARSEGLAFYVPSTRWRYLLTQPQALLLYLRLTVHPWPLCLDYQWPLVQSWRDVFWQAPLVAGIAGLFAYGAWRRRPWAFCGAWCFAILAPSSSLIPLPDVVFEHRMYLPLAGVLTGVVAGASHGLSLVPAKMAARLRLAGFTLLVALIPLLAAMTWMRNRDYLSEERMWNDVIAKRPDNHRAYVARSTMLLQEQRPYDAMQIARALMRRLPDYSRTPAGELTRQWQADRKMSVLYYAMAHNNLGAAFLAIDRNADALPHFLEAVRVMPQASWAHSNAAKALYFAGNTEAAIAAWRTALSIAPRDPQTLAFLAIALVSEGRDGEAVEKYREALRYSPGDAFIRAQLAWMLATHPEDSIRNGREAVRVAEPLVSMSQGLSVRALDVLAAAHAEAGEMDAAVRTAEQALSLTRRTAAPISATPSTVTPAGAPGPAAGVSPQDIQSRLDLYRAGKPYRSRAKPVAEK